MNLKKTVSIIATFLLLAIFSPRIFAQTIIDSFDIPNASLCSAPYNYSIMLLECANTTYTGNNDCFSGSCYYNDQINRGVYRYIPLSTSGIYSFYYAISGTAPEGSDETYVMFGTNGEDRPTMFGVVFETLTGKILDINYEGEVGSITGGVHLLEMELDIPNAQYRLRNDGGNWSSWFTAIGSDNTEIRAPDTVEIAPANNVSFYVDNITIPTLQQGGGGTGGTSWGTTTVGSAVNGSVLGASTSATSKLATIVPIGFAVLIGVVLAFWLFRKFKELAQLKEQNYWDGYREIKKGQEELYNDSLATEDKWAKFNEEDKNFGVDWKNFTDDMNNTYKV